MRNPLGAFVYPIAFLLCAAAIFAAIFVFFGHRTLSAREVLEMDCEKKGGVPVSIHGQIVCFASHVVIK